MAGDTLNKDTMASKLSMGPALVQHTHTQMAVQANKKNKTKHTPAEEAETMQVFVAKLRQRLTQLPCEGCDAEIHPEFRHCPWDSWLSADQTPLAFGFQTAARSWLSPENCSAGQAQVYGAGAGLEKRKAT